jgi:hypothetical protein
MATLNELQAQLDKLRAARGSGVLRVTDGSKSVEYQSLEDLTSAINQVVADIARLQGANGVAIPARTMRSMVRKGT